MNIQRKQELVQDWGFTKVEHGTGLYERLYVYADYGYKEFWESHNPDVIQFYKQGEGHTHDVKIHWELFDREAV